jgi:hypothetical protein
VRDHKDDQPKAVTASDAVIRLLVHEKLQPYKYNAAGDRVPILLPSQLCDMYRSLHGEWGLPLLAGITSAPILSEDGSIRTAEGFDPTTGLWCHSVPDIAGLVPEEPTEDQARLALAVLREAHKTFSFADAITIGDPGYARIVDLSRGDAIGQDEGAGLCAELTSVCRPSLETAPGVLVHGPNDSGSGVGKGLYVRYNAFMAFGIKPYAMGPGHGDNAEREKRIAGAANGGQFGTLSRQLERTHPVVKQSGVCADRAAGRDQAVWNAGSGQDRDQTDDLSDRQRAAARPGHVVPRVTD